MGTYYISMSRLCLFYVSLVVLLPLVSSYGKVLFIYRERIWLILVVLNLVVLLNSVEVLRCRLVSRTLLRH